MAHKPILLVGIGSSGLYVLEQVQSFYFENTGKNKPNYVEYLYIETNKDNEPGITALPSEIKRVYISLADMKIMIREMKEKYPDISWLPPEEYVIQAGMGAGGIPACGRLALWGKNSEGNNLKNVIDALQDMYNRVSGPGARDSDGSTPAVFITGSVTGGTGSGAFIDLAYLVRRIIPGIKELFSLILLPPDPDIVEGNEIIYANSYGSLRALDHFNDAKTTYSAHDRAFEPYKEPPFELTQLISQSYNAGLPKLSNLGGLYKMAGLYLFLNVVGLRGKRFERLVDASGNMQIGKYGTFGLSGIQYPKTQIEEFLALQIGGSLLDRWIDSDFYYQQNQKLKIDRGHITRDMNNRFSQILRGAFDNLNVLGGGGNIKADLKKQIQAMLAQEKGDPDQYTYKLFSPGFLEGYYVTVNNNIPNAMDFLVSSISDLVVNDFNKYENLYFAKEQLKVIADAIQNTLEYWKSLGISSFANKWENFLNDQVNWVWSGTYKLILEQPNVLYDRMLVVLDQMKMHLMVNKLLDLRKNILKDDIPLRTKTQLNKETDLPTHYTIDRLIQQVEMAIGKRDDVGDGQKFKSLAKRKSEIVKDMSDETIPILRIFKSGAFDREVDQSRQRYVNQSNKSYPNKDVLIGDLNLWDYLTNTDEGQNKLHRKLYRDCILKFRQELGRYDAVMDYDVSEYVANHPQDAVQYAAKSKYFLLPIRNKTLERSNNIPKVVIGSDKRVIGEVVDQLKNQRFDEFENKGDHMLEIPELKNIMVFYIEQANFDPVKDIAYIPDIEKIEAKYYKPKMSWEQWFAFRNPYLNIGPEAAGKFKPKEDA